MGVVLRLGRRTGHSSEGLSRQTSLNTGCEIISAFLKTVVLIKRRRRWGQQYNFPRLRIAHRRRNGLGHGPTHLRVDALQLTRKIRCFTANYVSLLNRADMR